MRQFPAGSGQQIPHVAVMWDESAMVFTYHDSEQALREGSPPVATQLLDLSNPEYTPGDPEQLRIHPHNLQEGEDAIVARRFLEVFEALRRK